MKEVRRVVRNVGGHIVSYLYIVDIWFKGGLERLSYWLFVLILGTVMLFLGFLSIPIDFNNWYSKSMKTVTVVFCLILKCVKNTVGKIYVFL